MALPFRQYYNRAEKQCKKRYDFTRRISETDRLIYDIEKRNIVYLRFGNIC